MVFYSRSGSDFENPEEKFAFMLALLFLWNDPSGSGAFIHDVAEALKNHFKYNPSLSHVQKSSYSETGWKNLIKQQIDSKKPMIYAGYSVSYLGHAWNCDGYQDDSFHMNWGWGGAGDGYYTLDNLTSSLLQEMIIILIKYNEMIINIYPIIKYPEQCQVKTNNR